MNPLSYIAILFLSGLGLFGIIGSGLHEVAQQAEQVPVLEQQLEEAQTLGAVNAVAGVPYYLHGSGVGATDTSITLTSFRTPVSSYPLSMADFGDIGYLTLEPGNTSRQEFISFTGISQNADNTAVLTGVTRGLSPVSPFTASSTIRKAHAGGSVAIISNPPQFYERFANKLNTQTITGPWTFASTSWPIIDLSTAAPTLDAQFATKKYVDDTAFNGAGVVNASVSARGVSEAATQIEVASSTSAGGTGALLFVPASSATSTYNSATAALRAVITQNSGFIDQGFMPSTITKNITFTGVTTFATTTVNGITIASTTVTTFDSSGTWSKPTSGTMAFIEVWGGGGSGGSSNNHAGAGGGGGGYSSRLMRLSELGSTETVTIGAGGTAVSNGNNGVAGGNTTFGSHLTGYGGGLGGTCSNDGGDEPASGGGGGMLNGAGANGADDADVTPDTAIRGMQVTGINLTGAQDGTAGLYSGAGGGCSQSGAGAGGASHYGGGGGGAAHNGGSEGAGGASNFGGAGGAGQDDTNGTAGTAPGGGGGANSSGGSSGAGAAGRVKVSVF